MLRISHYREYILFTPQFMMTFINLIFNASLRTILFKRTSFLGNLFLWIKVAQVHIPCTVELQLADKRFEPTEPK